MHRPTRPRRPPSLAVVAALALSLPLLSGIGCDDKSRRPAPAQEQSAIDALRESLLAERHRGESLEKERDRFAVATLHWRTVAVCLGLALAPVLLLGVAVGTGARRAAARKSEP